MKSKATALNPEGGWEPDPCRGEKVKSDIVYGGSDYGVDWDDAAQGADNTAT